MIKAVPTDIEMKRRYLWEGELTATSSISHKGETLGIISYLRREKVLQTDGSIIDVPIISGNSLRGTLRNISADLWWEAVGEPKLTVAVAHAIWSGGALAKTSGELLTGGRLVEVEKVCPVITIYGSAGGGRMLNGSLQVGKLVPICKETKHLLPNELSQSVESDLSFWDLIQIEYNHKIVTNYSATQGELFAPAKGESPASPMRYATETFVAGTRFYFKVAMDWPTFTSLSLFAETLENFKIAGKIGGKHASGHGDISVAFRKQTPYPKIGYFRKRWRDEVGDKLTLADLKILARLD